MPTPAERQALLFLGAVVCLGAGVRVMRAHEVPPPQASRRALDAQISAVDSTRRLRAAAGRAREAKPESAAKRRPQGRASGVGVVPRITVVQRGPAGPRQRVDVDRATQTDLQRLPGIGPALAARIVADRDSNGPFGSVAGLQRVKGIGKATAARLDSLVSFSGTPRPVSPRPVKPSGRVR